MADQVEAKLTLSNRYATLEHMQADEVQQSWTDFQQTIVEVAESTKTEDMLEPRKPWISESTMELIKLRAASKKQLLENEDKGKQNSYADRLRELRQEIKASARKDKKEVAERDHRRH